VSALADTLRAWTEKTETWRPLVRHEPDERTYALIHRDDEVELYLVCWMPGHDTGFHDHDHSSAAVAVIDGEVIEERLSLQGTVERRVAAGETITVAKEAIHRVRHAGEEPAITLHAYSPPLSRVGTYEIADDGALLRHPRPAETPLEAVA
jgi:predicted metal-dependent enzyme (double-stranded beta helix superfamily)